MQPLNIRAVQTDIVWQNASASLQLLDARISNAVEGEIVVLPEMFATGFTMEPETQAQTMDGEIVGWMKKQSRNRVVCGTVAIAEAGNYHNRFIWCQDGEVTHHYDKHHLFSHGDEQKHYMAGNAHCLIEYMGWKIKPFICYDLRFPVWCRNTDWAHLYLFCANWPAVRIQAWKQLLMARAIENQCFVLGVNRIGADGMGIAHNGQSVLIDAKGNELAIVNENNMDLIESIDSKTLLEYRKVFPVLNDADEFRFF